MAKAVVLKWENVESFVDKLYDKIVKSKYDFNYIIAISKGGLIPARLLVDKFKCGFGVIAASSYKYGDEKQQDRIIVNQNIAMVHQGHEMTKCLLIDDLVDSGKTIHKVQQTLKPVFPEGIKVAVLIKKKNCTFSPDFYVAETDKWVIYPWEKEEFKKLQGE